MAPLACPVCGENEKRRHRIHNKPRCYIECPKCGPFELSEMFEHDLREPSALRGTRPLLPYLSAYIRQTAEQRLPPPFINSENWEERARAHASTPLSEKTRRLLSLLGSRARAGKRADVHRIHDAALLDSFDEEEVKYLLDYLVERQMITPLPEIRLRPGDPPSGVSGYVLTMQGWQALEPGPGGIPGRCFVAMWFDDQVRDAYADGIRPALADDCNTYPVQLAFEQHNEKICDKILVEIRRAEFMVADVTGHRQNVYFEAGFAMALGRPVIWTCREDHFEGVKFDTQQYPYIKWTSPQNLREQLADRVRATIPSVRARLGSVERSP